MREKEYSLRRVLFFTSNGRSFSLFEPKTPREQVGNKATRRVLLSARPGPFHHLGLFCHKRAFRPRVQTFPALFLKFSPKGSIRSGCSANTFDCSLWSDVPRWFSTLFARRGVIPPFPLSAGKPINDERCVAWASFDRSSADNHPSNLLFFPPSFYETSSRVALHFPFLTYPSELKNQRNDLWLLSFKSR